MVKQNRPSKTGADRKSPAKPVSGSGGLLLPPPRKGNIVPVSSQPAKVGVVASSTPIVSASSKHTPEPFSDR